MVKKLIFIPLLLLSFVFFYEQSEENYKKHVEITQKTISHPEFIPTKEFAELTSFGFKNIKADWYWLKTVNYIGGNIFGAEYKKYLYEITTLINHLNPYFEHPYTTAQILLPSENKRYESLTPEDLKRYQDQAKKIGEYGIKVFCDADKLEKIKNEDDLSKLFNSEEYKQPCKVSTIPFNQAYISFYYFNNPSDASYYFKITSSQKDASETDKTLAAIMAGKGGDRQKATLMLLGLALSDSEENEETNVCKTVSNQILGITNVKYQQGVEYSPTLIKQIEELRKKFGIKNDEIKDGSCFDYLSKATREINLQYMDDANKRYFEAKGENAEDQFTLKKEGFIGFNPTDYQQGEDDGMMYFYSKEINRFDRERRAKPFIKVNE